MEKSCGKIDVREIEKKCVLLLISAWTSKDDFDSFYISFLLLSSWNSTRIYDIIEIRSEWKTAKRSEKETKKNWNTWFFFLQTSITCRKLNRPRKKRRQLKSLRISWIFDEPYKIQLLEQSRFAKKKLCDANAFSLKFNSKFKSYQGAFVVTFKQFWEEEKKKLCRAKSSVECSSTRQKGSWIMNEIDNWIMNTHWIIFRQFKWFFEFQINLRWNCDVR